jgi:hypothetical protein
VGRRSPSIRFPVPADAIGTISAKRDDRFAPCRDAAMMDHGNICPEEGVVLEDDSAVWKPVTYVRKFGMIVSQ